MKLAVINGSNRIANGFIKTVLDSSKFQSIKVADLYPHYNSISKFLKFHNVECAGNPILKDVKVSQKSELREIIEDSTHVAYFTHNYYSLVPSKQSMLKNTVEILTKAKDIKSVFVLPAELDHYSEKNLKAVITDSENLIFDSLPESNYFRSHLTGGKYSEFIDHAIASILSGKKALYGKTSHQHYLVDSEELSKEIASAFETKKGKKYLVKGPEALTIEDIMGYLVKEKGASSINSVQKLEAGFMNEWKYTPEEMNYVNFTHNGFVQGNEGLETLTLKVKSLEKLGGVLKSEELIQNQAVTQVSENSK